MEDNRYYKCDKCGEIVSKIDQQVTVDGFDSHWVSHTSSLVPNLSKFSNRQTRETSEITSKILFGILTYRRLI